MFKKYSSSKRDYLAKEFLIQLLNNSEVVSLLLKSRLYDDTNTEDTIEGILVDKSIHLADLLTLRLAPLASSNESTDEENYFPEVSIPIIDGDFEAM